MQRMTLTRETEALVVRSGHPLTQGPLTRERLFAFPHVVVEMTGTSEGRSDGFVDDRGVERRVWFERLLIELQEEGIDLDGQGGGSCPAFRCGSATPLLY